MPLARACSSSFFMAGSEAMHRGRVPQVGGTKSSISRAVVFGSTVTGFSAGAGGAFTLGHSSTMVCAPDSAGISAARAAARVHQR